MEATEIRLKEIEEEIDRLYTIIDEKIKKWDYKRPFNEYEKYLEKEYSQIGKLDQESRMIMPYELSELSDYGDEMLLKDFIKAVKDGFFIDYDGYGRYIKDGKESDITIYPSDVIDGAIRPDFDKIIWFNR